MKKFLLVALTFVIGMAFALPSWAFESEFGGYWRTRAYVQQNFDGTDSGTSSVVDTRTRLYYTAKFSDNFKFVNKFEFDPIYGDKDAGKIGADGKIFEIKNSYVDLTLADHNLKVGVQPAVIARGLMFDDDFSGITWSYKIGDINIPLTWMSAANSDLGDSNSGNPGLQPIVDLIGEDNLAGANINTNMFAVNPTINLDENTSISPFLMYVKVSGTALGDTDTGVYYLGTDVDMKMGDTTLWGTAILQGGEILSDDVFAYLFAAGADAGLVHGQFFYASGDDGDDDDIDVFLAPSGQCYYWSEILGYGILGDTGPISGELADVAPNTTISNVMAFNVGTTLKPMDKLTVKGDIWYAALIEETANSNGETDLGIELNLLATYEVMDNLKLDVVAAYLIAGDAFGDEDATEIGTRLSFGF